MVFDLCDRKLPEYSMSFQGLGFAIAVGIGLATAIFYYLSQKGGEAPHGNNNNRNNNGGPPPGPEPYTSSWHQG